MTTPHTHTLVSLTATMAVTLALAACAPGRSVPSIDRPIALDGRLLTVGFDNDGREHVHVYLVDARQGQWLLGRVDPWSQGTLRIPAAALVGSNGFVRLAVVPGERMTPQAVRSPRATFTVAQPVSAILTQRYMFAQGQLTPLPFRRAGVDVARQ